MARHCRDEMNDAGSLRRAFDEAGDLARAPVLDFSPATPAPFFYLPVAVAAYGKSTQSLCFLYHLYPPWKTGMIG